MPTAFDHKDVANRVFHFYSAQHTSLQTWAFYLFDESFSHEQELRNKAATIWFCALYDALEGELRLLPDLQAAACGIGRRRLTYYADRISEMCLGIRTFLSKYTKAEQLFLYDFRCQIVHTWGANVFQPMVRIKYVEAKTFKQEALPRDDYRQLIRSFYENGTLDETLARLLAPIWRKEEPFLIGILNLLFVPGNLETLRREIFEGVP